MKDVLYDVCKADGRYSVEAFHFLYQGLEKAAEMVGRDASSGEQRHVSGQELLGGLRACAAQMFGPLAAQVWRSWGVTDTLDWGRIVFLLVEANLLNSQESDSVEDFGEGFDFEEAFVVGYKPILPVELGARPQPDND